MSGHSRIRAVLSITFKVLTLCVISFILYFYYHIERPSDASERLDIAVPKYIGRPLDSSLESTGETTAQVVVNGLYCNDSTHWINEIGLPFDIVPNTVHYVLFAICEIQFGHFVSILSVLKNQKPDLIYVHTDCYRLSGQYWDRALKLAYKVNSNLMVRKVEKPLEVFGKRLSVPNLNWHAADITRIRVLMEMGGIYLDRDMYLIGPVNLFFKYEMTMDWPPGFPYFQAGIIIGHRNARFLKLWHDSYRSYDPNTWAENLIVWPTKKILRKNPSLVHRAVQFGSWCNITSPYLYTSYQKNWRTDYLAIHLTFRGNEVAVMDYCFGDTTNFPNVTFFDEKVVKTSDVTFAEMVRDVLQFEKKFSN